MLNDITRSRHRGNLQSIDANLMATPHKASWREKVFTLMAYREQAGYAGTTLMDACKAFSKERGQLSGRFSELKADDLITPTGIVIDGFMQYRIARAK